MKEEPHPGQIVIEVEEIEIDAAHAGDADEDELLGHIGDGWVQTSNLPVKAIAVRSVFASEYYEQRLAARTCRLFGLFPIAQPVRRGRFLANLGSNASVKKKTQNEKADQPPPSSAHTLFSFPRIISWRRSSR